MCKMNQENGRKNIWKVRYITKWSHILIFISHRLKTACLWFVYLFKFAEGLVLTRLLYPSHKFL